MHFTLSRSMELNLNCELHKLGRRKMHASFLILRNYTLWIFFTKQRTIHSHPLLKWHSVIHCFPRMKFGKMAGDIRWDVISDCPTFAVIPVPPLQHAPWISVTPNIPKYSTHFHLSPRFYTLWFLLGTLPPISSA